MTPECQKIAEMVQAGELKVWQGKVVTHHLSVGTMYVQLPYWTEHNGKKYWVQSDSKWRSE